MSRYDYPDPGCDPVYCDSLSSQTVDSCLWCGGECDACSPYLPYCDPDCAHAAQREDIDGCPEYTEYPYDN